MSAEDICFAAKPATLGSIANLITIHIWKSPSLKVLAIVYCPTASTPLRTLRTRMSTLVFTSRRKEAGMLRRPNEITSLRISVISSSCLQNPFIAELEKTTNPKRTMNSAQLITTGIHVHGRFALTTKRTVSNINKNRDPFAIAAAFMFPSPLVYETRTFVNGKRKRAT